MADFLRSIGFGDSTTPNRTGSTNNYNTRSAPPNTHHIPHSSPALNGTRQPPSSYGSSYSPDPRGYASGRSGYPSSSFASPTPASHPSRSPQPPSAGQRSPMPVANPPTQQTTDEWQHATLDQLRSDQQRREHDLSVSQSRLQHCFDGGDADGAGIAAQSIAREKKALRELSLYLASRERQLSAEQKVRASITQKFGGEKATVHEHRRQVRMLKQRLRVAFAIPAVCGDKRSASPPACASPPHSPAPSSTSPHDSSLCDLIAKVKQDIGRHQVALEHQCLHVDSIELQICVNAANVYDTAAAPGGAPDSSPPLSAPLLPWSDDLTSFFKSSRKDVVTTLQSVLVEVDGLTKHIKHAEEFVEYLRTE